MDIQNELSLSTPDLRLAQDRVQMREVAKEFEAVFLAEMLKHAGLSESRESFGGGAGEAAFNTMLADEQARHMVDAGGIGLAAHIFESLLAREGGI